MHVLGSLSLAGANGNDSFRLSSWRKGMAGDGVMLELAMPVSVGTAGTPTVTDLVNLLRYFFSQVTLAYGPAQQWKALEGADGAEMRSIYRAMQLKEVANDFVGVAQTTGIKTFRARMVVLFSHPLMRGRRKRPGWSQCQTIRLDVTEGSVLTAGALNLTRAAGNCVINVVPLYCFAGNNFVHLPHFRRINQSKLDVETPSGLVLAAWDENAPFASTAIQKYSVHVGERELYRDVPPLYVDDEWARAVEAGGSDLTDAVTMLYFAHPYGSMEEAPHGRVYVRLLSQDVPTIKLRALYYPDADEDHVKAMVEHVASENRAPILATTPELDDRAAEGAAAVAPHELVAHDDPRFQAVPGILATPGGQAQLSIPAHVLAMVGQAAGQAGASKEAVARVAQKAVAKRIPGAIGTDGLTRGGALGKSRIRETFAHLFR